MLQAVGLALQGLALKCHVFDDALRKQIEGILDEETSKMWTMFLVNSKKYEAAKEFTKLFPDFEESDLDFVEDLIQTNKSNPFHPHGCYTCGCSDEKITECHPKLIRNKNGEASNSPAFHITDDKLEALQFKLEFEELREQVYEDIAAGDSSAHLDPKYISAVARLKVLDQQAYENLLSDYKQEKIAVSAFKEAVEKASKEVRSNIQTSVRQEANLSETLKPYTEGLENSSIIIGEDGGYYVVTQTKDGEAIEKLTNFVARIPEVLVRDDGVMKNIFFKIEGIANGTDILPTAIIEAKSFCNMLWITPTWGNQAILDPKASKDTVRFAIQATSKNAPEILVHYQLGFKKIDGLFSFFHSNGVIGDPKNTTDEIVELKGYGFPEVKANVLDCFKAVKVFLEVAPKEITMLLLSFLMLPLLAEKLKEDNIIIRFVVWLYGKTGSLKTSLALAGMGFYGDFINPPSTFSDTITAIERQLYLAKDCPVLIDDYCPSSNMTEKRSKESLANKVIRMVGDGVGKKRAKSNLELNITYPPRGVVLVTGEDVLSGHSSNSRLLNQVVNYGDIDPKKLSYLQENKHLLGAFTYHYVNYLVDNVYNADGISYKDEFLSYRNSAKNENHHKRFADSVACLQVSLNQLLKFMIHIGAINETEYQEMFDEGFRTFLKIAERQNEMALAQDVVARYMSALQELIATKQIVPMDKNAAMHLANQSTVCYHDADNYYFVPQSTYAKVADFLLRKGELLGISDFMIRRMLADRGIIAKPSDGDNHLTTKIKIGLSQVRVIQIPKRVMEQF